MKNDGVKPRTINYAHSVLHNALDHAVRRSYLASNPSTGAVRPKYEKREMQSMTAAQAQALLGASVGNRFEALWHLLLLGGLRPCEALGLKWPDLKDHTVTVQRSLRFDRKAKRFVFGPPKTKSSRRSVVLPPETVVLLRAHKALQNAARLRAGTAWLDIELIFCNETGGPLEWRLISRRYLRPVMKRAGVANFRPYDMRHSCASLLLASGESPKIVSERLGHADVAFTLDTYGHILPGQQQRAADILGEMLYQPSRKGVSR